MDPWQQWFLDQLSERQWTSDELARQSRISSTMISRYRRGKATPRRADQIAKLVEVFGDAGPLPEREREERILLVERVDELERRVAELSRRWDALNAGDSDPDGRRAAIAGLADDLADRDATVGARGPQPKRKRRGS